MIYLAFLKLTVPRVGCGPFPTELHDETGANLRNIGNEFGSTTGRPRRCGWLDLPAMKYSIMINGITRLFMTKADVMSGFKTIKVCTSYKINGKNAMNCHLAMIVILNRFTPKWKDGMKILQDTGNINELPAALKKYIEFIEKQTGVPVTMVSVGPDREETIFRK